MDNNTALNAIFQEIIDSVYPGLNNARKPAGTTEVFKAALDATTCGGDFVACESCGAPSTHNELDPGDASVGIPSSWIELCDDCGRSR